MSFKHKYDITIESCVGDETLGYEERGGATWGSIISHGDTLDELLNNATIVIENYDGEYIDEVTCDEEWMIQLIVKEYANQLNKIGD